MENLISHAKSVAYCGILCTMFVEFPWVLFCALRISMGAPELCYVLDPFGCCATIYFFLWVCSSRSFAVVTMMSFRSILLRAVVGDEIFMGACVFHILSIALLASCSCYLTGVRLQCIRLSVIMSFTIISFTIISFTIIFLYEPTATWQRWFAWVCRTGTESDILVRFCLIRI